MGTGFRTIPFPSSILADDGRERTCRHALTMVTPVLAQTGHQQQGLCAQKLRALFLQTQRALGSIQTRHGIIHGSGAQESSKLCAALRICWRGMLRGWHRG